MNLVVMDSAERHDELIADLEGEASWLRECQVMGVRRNSLANKTRKCRHVAKMGFVANAASCLEREGGLVDARPVSDV
jgi:hypothetical protein